MELAVLTPTDKKRNHRNGLYWARRYGADPLGRASLCVSTIQDVRPVAKRLEMEAALNVDELLALKAVLRVTHELKDFYDNLENVRLERLHRLFDNLVDLSSPTRWASSYQRRRLCRVFASEKLAKIRRRIQENEHQVRDSTRPAEKQGRYVGGCCDC